MRQYALIGPRPAGTPTSDSFAFCCSDGGGARGGNDVDSQRYCFEDLHAFVMIPRRSQCRQIALHSSLAPTLSSRGARA